MPSLQVLGKKFKKLSWTKFVDMIINNELSLHNELGIIFFLPLKFICFILNS